MKCKQKVVLKFVENGLQPAITIDKSLFQCPRE